MNIKKTLLRVLVVSFSATLIVVLFLFISQINSKRILENLPLSMFLYILIFNIASEGNVTIDRYFNRKMPWFTHAKKRLVRQIPLSLGLTLLIASISVYVIRYMVFGVEPVHVPRFAIFAFVLGFIFLITFNGILLAVNFFNNWRTSYQEMEDLRREKLKSDYKLLQDQVNPHFLFNSFNVLISEIDHDPKVAVLFTRQLSRVYRYVLQSKNQDLIPLKEELDFIQSFVYLHQIRIGDSLKFELNMDEKINHYYLPPLTLQILIENVVKHNIVNQENPLIIIISIEDTLLTVKNNLNPKMAVESTNTGLSNIKNRYKLLGNYDIEVIKSDSEFVVKVPLIIE